MRKQLCLDLESLIYEYPTSEFDIGGKGHEIVIEFSDKKDFINEITKQFREKVKASLELQYVCEWCGEEYEISESIYDCKVCGGEICCTCEVLDGVCDNCSTNTVKR